MLPTTRLVAPLGPNPAPVTELLWHLVAVEGRRVTALHLVVESRHAAGYLDLELRPALEALRRQHPGVPETTRIFAADDLPADEHDPRLTTALEGPLWEAAVAATDGEEPVVFGLTGGRHRASTALQTTVFQLLARAEDRLVDVRVTDPRAEGGTGFFFPTQGGPTLRARDGSSFEAHEVGVRVQPVDVPRLSAFVDPEDRADLPTARRAAQQALHAERPVRLDLDLEAGTLHLDGERVRLSPDQLVVYAQLVLLARTGDRVPSADVEGAGRLLRSLADGAGWARRVRGLGLKHQLDVDAAGRPVAWDGPAGGMRELHDRESLSTARAEARRRLVAFTDGRREALRAAVPTRRKHLDGVWEQWLALPPTARIRVTGDPHLDPPTLGSRHPRDEAS